jgi:hypothetical protein
VCCPLEIDDIEGLYNPVHDWFEFARRLVELLRGANARRLTDPGRQRIERLLTGEHAYGGLGSALDAFFDEAGIAPPGESAS